MQNFQRKALINYFLEQVTDSKKDLINKVLEDRTRYITVALEDVFQPHNKSAVLRSLDCFGLNDMHVIEDRYKYRPAKSVDKGASNWVDVKKYKNTQDCYNKLRESGYKIVATMPHAKSCSIDQLLLDNKIALIFGTEQKGLTKEALMLADEYVTIPMYGFTESFNISVSVAICLYELTKKLRLSEFAWRLTEEEREILKLTWLKASVHGGDYLEKIFLEKLK